MVLQKRVENVAACDGIIVNVRNPVCLTHERIIEDKCLYSSQPTCRLGEFEYI